MGRCVAAGRVLQAGGRVLQAGGRQEQGIGGAAVGPALGPREGLGLSMRPEEHAQLEDKSLQWAFWRVLSGGGSDATCGERVPERKQGK